MRVDQLCDYNDVLGRLLYMEAIPVLCTNHCYCV